MTYNVIVTPTADAAAMEAVAWYAERSTDAAQQWHERLKRAINSLAKLPTRCPVSQEDSKALACEVWLLLYGKRRGAPPSAPVIASNQQGESPCQSVLALCNRK